MVICTYNTRTLASGAAIKDLMMQAGKIKYDAIGVTETRRRYPLNALYESGEEQFLGTSNARRVDIKLTEVSQEYKMPLCLTFINLKAFDSVEREAIMEALDNRLYSSRHPYSARKGTTTMYTNLVTGISPFYKNIIIDVKRGVRQGGTISP
ncbi:hypothetical protein RB195_010525 [Necator americanus]|uniref:Reverse transcriptase domain-containing protein n=1 Tax=Necator americanus TaxID=51031 RepID=A0ABR1CYB6_NECAM